MKDTFSLVPPEIKARYDAEEAIERQSGSIRYLDKALKAKDPNLGLVWVKSDVPEWDLPVGAVAGRWHIQVKSPASVTTYIPIVGPKGECREPAWDVLDIVDRNDLHRPEVFRRAAELSQRRREARQRKKDLQSEQQRYDAVTDFKAAKRVAGEGGLTKSKWGRG